MKIAFYSFLLSLSVMMSINPKQAQAHQTKQIRVLIVDGQNNHDQWAKITFMMKKYLEETGLFKVDVNRSYYTWNGKQYIAQFPILGLRETVELKSPKADSSFSPDFSKYDLIICNFGWNAAPWPEATNKKFEKFIRKGGGLVVIHAADNSFPAWPAYNEMIGLGGWGDRTEKDGPYVYYDNNGNLVRDSSAGKAGSHGPQREFQVNLRNASHPITQGMPLNWMHTKDEMYDRLRGPANNMEVLATSFSAIDQKGTGRHEPMLLVLNYGKGRIFHTPLGHADYSVSCVGFITCLLRGSEWAATGKVSLPIPADFPTADKSSSREFK